MATLLVVMMISFPVFKAQTCSDNFRINTNHIGKRLQGHSLGYIFETNLYECVKKCFHVTQCLSINFEKSGICELNDMNSSQALSVDMVQDNTYIFSDISEWPKEMAGVCGDRPCGDLEMCLPAGQSYVCRTPDLRSCPDGWSTFREPCYLFMTERVNFEDATGLCGGEGGHLVKVDTSTENDFLKEKLRNLDPFKWWIGLSDMAVEGVWRWLDGDISGYLNWGGVQPNNGIVSNCACFWQPLDFEWADEPCSTLYQPICEMLMK